MEKDIEIEHVQLDLSAEVVEDRLFRALNILVSVDDILIYEKNKK
jgi:hypothetical protein